MPSAHSTKLPLLLRPLSLAALLLGCQPQPPPVLSGSSPAALAQHPPQARAPAMPLPVPVSATLAPALPADPPAPPTRLATDARLVSVAGSDRAVLVDARGDGVWARTLDGSVDERLVGGVWNTVWPDAAARVLWLWRESSGTLAVVDLTQVQPTGLDLPQAVTVATGVDAGVSLSPLIRPAAPRLAQRTAVEGETTVGPRLRLDLAAQPPGFWYRSPPQPGHWRDPPLWRPCTRTGYKPVSPRCPHLAPNASPLLGILAARALAAVAPGPTPVPGRLRTLLPGCAREACGRPVALPGTRWWLVPAAVWTDCCRRGYQLYDHESQRFLRLTTGQLHPGPSTDRRDAVEFLWLCPGGEAVVTESGVVPLEPPGPLQFGRADACLGALPVRVPSQPCPQGDQCEEEPAIADPDGLGVD